MAKRTKKRDYKAEYKRRLARGKRLGYSKAVARGHVPKGQLGIKAAHRRRVKPGTYVRDLPFHGTGRSVDEATIRREREALEREGISIRDINKIDFHDEKSFIQMLEGLGYTTHEAYRLRFSP